MPRDIIAENWYDRFYSFLSKNGIDILKPEETLNVRIENKKDGNISYQYAMLYTDTNQNYHVSQPAMNHDAKDAKAQDHNAINAGFWYLEEHNRFVNSMDFEIYNGQHLYKAFLEGNLVIVKDGKKQTVKEENGDLFLTDPEAVAENAQSAEDKSLEENVQKFMDDGGSSYHDFLTQGRVYNRTTRTAEQPNFFFGSYAYPDDIKMTLAKDTAASQAETCKKLMKELKKHSIIFHHNNYYKDMMDTMETLAKYENKKKLTVEELANKYELQDKLKDQAYHYMNRKVHNTIQYSDTAKARMEVALRCYNYAATAARPVERKDPGMLMSLPMSEEMLTTWYDQFKAQLTEAGVDFNNPTSIQRVQSVNSVGIMEDRSDVRINTFTFAYKKTKGTYRDEPPAKEDNETQAAYDDRAMAWYKEQLKSVKHPDLETIRKIHEDFMSSKIIIFDEKGGQLPLYPDEKGQVCVGKSLNEMADLCPELSMMPEKGFIREIRNHLKSKDPYGKKKQADREFMKKKIEIAKEIGLTKDTTNEEIEKNQDVYAQRMENVIVKRAKKVFPEYSERTLRNFVHCNQLSCNGTGIGVANYQGYDDTHLRINTIGKTFTKDSFVEWEKDHPTCMGQEGIDELALANHLTGKSMMMALQGGHQQFFVYEFHKNANELKESSAFQNTVQQIKTSYESVLKASPEERMQIPNADKILKMDMRWAEDIFMNDLEKHLQQQIRPIEKGDDSIQKEQSVPGPAMVY